MPDNCPSHDELSGFFRGTLDPQRKTQVAEHVQQCPPCDATMARLESDANTSPNFEIPGTSSPSEGTPRNELYAATIDHRPESDDPGEPSEPGRGNHQSSKNRETIRDYKLLAKLGEGGMGAVYKAIHTKLDKVVALKVLPPHCLKDQAAVARFEREMRAVGKLDHPNIVRATDAGEDDGIHYLVMEYVEGSDLSAVLNERGPLPIAEACDYIRQAAIGLQYAHEHRMVHRDIKPGNLMLANPMASGGRQPSDSGLSHQLTNAGRSPTIKILDLGLALLDDLKGVGGKELTETGRIMGTLDYMAPEQGGDSHDVDIRADVYSLGATLYKLLCGQAPFSDSKYNSPIKKLMALATEEPQPIAERRQEVPTRLAEIVHRMLAKSPEDRFATPGEVAEALTPFAPRTVAVVPQRPSESSLSMVPARPEPAPARPPRKDHSANSASASGIQRAPPKPVAPSQPLIAVTPSESPRDRLHKKGSKPKSKLALAVVAIGLLAVVGIGITLAVVLNRGEDTNLAADGGLKSGQPSTVGQDTRNASQTGGGFQLPQPLDNPTATDEPTPNGPASAIEDEAVAQDPDEPVQPPPSTPEPRPLISPPPGERADLLALVDLEKDFKSGNWQRTADALVAPGEPLARLQLPVELPPEYDLTLKLDLPAPIEDDDEFVIGLASSEHRFLVVLDGADRRSGLQKVDGKAFNDPGNETSHSGQLLLPGKENVVTCKVRSTGVTVICNGVPAIDWKGELQRLDMGDTPWKTPEAAAAMIGTSSACRVTSIELINGGVNKPESVLASLLYLQHREFDFGAAAERRPVPDDDDLKSKRVELLRALKKETAAARTPQQAKSLAESLLKRGKDSKDDAERYVYHELAGSAAGNIGEIPLALAAADELANYFDVDALVKKVEAIERVAQVAKSRETFLDAVKMAVQLFDEAIERDQYDDADRLVSLIRNVGRELRDADLTNTATTMAQHAKVLRTAYEAVRESLQAAADDADNAEANLAAGQFLCYSKGDWDRGLLNLARGNDPALKALAEKDLVFPLPADEQAAIGNGWWDIAQSKSGHERKHLELRAYHWYDLAVSDLSGQVVETVTQRIAQIREKYPADVRPIVDYSNVTPYATLEGHKNLVFSVAFSPDGQLLASASDDGLVKIWDVIAAKELFSLQGHKDGVTSVSFSWNGKVLASAGKDGAIILWDPITGRMIKRLDRWSDLPHRVEFAPRSYLFSVMSTLDRKIPTDYSVLWSASNCSEIAKLSGQHFAVWSPNAATIATAATGEREVKLWSASGRFLTALVGPSDKVISADYSRDGRTLVSAGQDNTAFIWNIETGTSRLRVAVEHFWLDQIALSPDGTIFSTNRGTVGLNDFIKLWRTNDGKEVTSLRLPHGSEARQTFSPDGTFLAAGCADNAVRLWSFATIKSTPYPDNIHPFLKYKMGHHPVDAVQIGSHWFKFFVPGDRKREVAEKWCQENGGYLACVESEAEALALAKLANGKRVWLGGRKDRAGTWRWINGSPVPIRYWTKGKPDDSDPGNVFLMTSEDGRWEAFKPDASCDGFICEWEF